MGHVSRPIQITLLVAIVFAGLWMVVLKPKAAAEEPVAPAPVAAQPAVAEPAAEPAAPAAEAAAPAAPAEPAAKTAKAKPAPKPAAAAPITVVALVGTGEDDAVARELVAELDGVRTVVVPIEEIGRYEDLIGAVEIRQTPTILVIGADRRAQRIEGLPDAAQLEQALAAARR